jgi:hypothetical protein
MPNLHKSVVMKDIFLPPWVNSLHTHPADSFGNLAFSTNKSRLSVHTANSNKPPAPNPSIGSCNFHNTAGQNCGQITDYLQYVLHTETQIRRSYAFLKSIIFETQILIVHYIHMFSLALPPKLIMTCTAPAAPSYPSLKTHSMAVRAIPLSACHQGPPNGYRTGFK